MISGVSCVICTYNGAQRLPETIAHLLLQKVDADLSWEVVLVDNNSTDNSIAVVTTAWTESDVPLRVVHEEKQGTTYAREKGLQIATFDVVCFIDDDVWVDENYVQRTSVLMKDHPECDIMGGFGIAQTDIELPPWFELYQDRFVIR